MASFPSSLSEPIPIPRWLETLRDAPVYRPTLSDFADPISFISRIEHHASRFGICKVIPPLPKPPKSSVLRHLQDSLHAAPFTTRHQELASKKSCKTKQVWQSGEFYSMEQFEAKSKSFAKSQLHGLKEVTPLLVEALFWDAVAEKPITVEYANDVPGSAFAPRRRRKRKREEGASWSLADSPWNLQVIARSPGSLTRFMPDDIPGVTSPMVYIAMLFSWFAWHVEDHELHSLNFLHMGAPKTWYAVPGEYAASVEEVVRVKGYGGNVDRLAAFMMLGEKTTLLSPEVLVEAGIPCCRLVQYPGEFVVTFPRAYHVGFSHGFNCGEAANFATPQWLDVAKEAAVRRAAMNHLPMLSHQQLLYMLTTSFISRVPRGLEGVRSSRLRDREKERELLIKRAFLNDMMDENHKLHILLEKESIPGVLLWEPEMLPSSNGSQSNTFSSSVGAQLSAINDEREREISCYDPKLKDLSNLGSENCFKENFLLGGPASLTSVPLHSLSSGTVEKDVRHIGCMSSDGEAMEKIDDDAENELPFGLHVDSGTLACVACGILGYPFMAIVHPSEITLEEIASLSHGEYKQRLENSEQFRTCQPSYAQTTTKSCSVDFQESGMELEELPNQESISDSASRLCDHAPCTEGQNNRCGSELLKNGFKESSCNAANMSTVIARKPGPDGYIRPRIFCLQHATEVAELLQHKGLRMLIICHSDYLKIKALAIAVAEEIGMQFNFKDFPIMDASPADLDLINVSIDDDGREDWTSKLGINLSYFIKVGRQLSSNQEPLPISLSRIFSDPPPVSVVSNLKWHCRKSRTSYKVIGTVHSIPTINPDAEADEATLENSKADSLKANKVYLRCKRDASAFHIKHHGERLADRTRGFFSNQETMMGEEGDDVNRYPGFSLSEDHMGAFWTESLVTVPVFAAESILIHQASWSEKNTTSPLTGDSVEIGKFVLHVDVATEDCEKHLGINSDDEASRMFGCGSVKPGCSQSSSDASTLGNFVLHQNEVAQDIVTSSHEVGGSEFWVNVVIEEVQHFEALEKIKPVNDNSPRKSDRNFAPDGESTLKKHLNNIHEHLQENVAAHKSSLVGNLHNSSMEEDDDNCGLVIVHSELQDDDIPHARESAEQCYEYHRMQIGENLVMDGAIVDGSEMKWKIESATSPEGVGEFSSCVESEGLHDVISVPETSGTTLEASNYADANMKHVEDNLVELESWVDGVKGLVVEKVNQNTADVYSVPQHASLHDAIASEKIRPIIVYKRASRPKKKQIIEAEMMTTDQRSSNEFIRSPCEGLRPRTGRAAVGTGESIVVPKVDSKPRKRQDSSIERRSKHLAEGTFKCEIEGCHISFRTKRELDRHHDNRCIFKGCGKRFSSHMLAVRHQRAHEDERPLKCPWRGCNMSFKWAWARTEHVRLHTGERPYKCKVTGCGLTFRFVSDFSRHRRKTGHYGNSKT